jgi:hypothetical protein
MDILVIGSAKRPRCFGKTWKPEDDDECQLTKALAESDELTAAEACDDDSEEVKIIDSEGGQSSQCSPDALFGREQVCCLSRSQHSAKQDDVHY